MNKIICMTTVLGLLLAGSLCLVPSVFSTPPISRQMGFIEENVQGGNPITVDYSIAYDTASGELIQNMMDNLIVFNGEHTDQFLPALATSWSSGPLGSGGDGVDSGLPISGLLFESPNQTGPNAKYFYQYVFRIRTGASFQPPYNYSLTPADVAFSFQRTMIIDVVGGPQWMIQEPLLDIGTGTLSQAEGDLGADLPNATQVAELGALIEHSVGFNATHVWFNLMFPGAYTPFMQILTQTWSSIESKQWIDNQVYNDPARSPYEWDGNWPDTTSWLSYRRPENNPLDNPTPAFYGSGPFIITTLDYENMFWSGIRHIMYWRGWPADFPSASGCQPSGYVDTIYITWAYDWPTRRSDLASGAADFAAVPFGNFFEVFKGPRPYTPPNYPIDGVRCYYPLSELALNAFFFTFNINPATIYGLIGTPDTFGETLIPSDFFGNAVWGIKVRQGFAEAFDYNTYLGISTVGDAIHPATAIIPGLLYHDAGVAAWMYNPAAAGASLNLVGPDSNGKMLKDVGFTITLVYYGGGSRLTACNLMKSAIESLNPLYHVNIVSVSYSSYLDDAITHKLPTFIMGWMADFADPHDFALPFYHTGGYYASRQAYSNPTMDALVDQGIAIPDGPTRATVYHNIQVLAVSDCPDFTLDQRVGRSFERDWVQGWFYNLVYPGQYFYGLWKWYYQSESQLSVAQNPPAVPSSLAGWNLPADVNYDGKVDMRDIGIIAKAFGTGYGPPQDTRWVFPADINNDRRIDMKDIGLAARQFGKTSAVWSPSSVPAAVSPGLGVDAHPMVGVGLIFDNVTTWGYVTVDTSLTAPAPLDNPKGPYYLAGVTASFSGNVTVSLAFDGSNMTETQKDNLRMMQYSSGPGWVDITTFVDTTHDIIYGETSHFSFISIH